jgi:hypothetical protein
MGTAILLVPDWNATTCHGQGHSQAPPVRAKMACEGGMSFVNDYREMLYDYEITCQTASAGHHYSWHLKLHELKAVA